MIYKAEDQHSSATYKTLFEPIVVSAFLSQTLVNCLYLTKISVTTMDNKHVQYFKDIFYTLMLTR